MTTDKEIAKSNVLVVGGGISGINAALDLAEKGFKVYLVEKGSSIGGHMAQLDKTFPTLDCSACILTPEMVEVQRHDNIKLLTNTEVEEVEGSVGNFIVKICIKRRYVDAGICKGCIEDCASVCPIKVPSEFDASVGERKAIYIPFPQSVPLIAKIDSEHCIGCRLCEKACELEAIDYLQKENEEEIRVGAIILALGYDFFDPSVLTEYGYTKYKNVITAIEYERLICASGPLSGHLEKPSDGKEPKRIAFIQCVGSRDKKYVPYCSSVCCMYATKEGILAKELYPDSDIYIFYIDLRAFGKGFEGFVKRAKEEYGIRYIRGNPGEIIEEKDKKSLVIQYEDTEKEEVKRLEVDLVVLSHALVPSKHVKEIADKIGLELDKYSFFKSPSFSPTESSVPGVYVCGFGERPMDIPDSVAQGSGASSKVACLLKGERKALIKEKEYPEERDVTDEELRIGVFICHCGTNIGGVIDVEEVEEYGKKLENVVYTTRNLYTCSYDGNERIKEAIKEYNLNRVVVAACTPRTYEIFFQETCAEAGLNPYLFEFVNIREHCSWVHAKDKEKATNKAKDLLRMGVAKARLLRPISEIKVPITPRALVIGGGISGMTTALDIANQGFKVYIVEKEEEIGGFLQKIVELHNGRIAAEMLKDLKEEIERNERIEVVKNAEIKKVEGYVGNFEVELSKKGEKDGESKERIKAGAVIIATGGKELEKPFKEEKVFSQIEFERYLESVKEEDLKGKTIAMVQCVGARNEKRPYCSRICCTEAIKNAIKVKKICKETKVVILFRDIVMYGTLEDLFEEATGKNVIFMRYNGEWEFKQNILCSHGQANEEIRIGVDILVLSMPLVPAEGNEEISKLFKVPIDGNSFFCEAHPKLHPVEFSTKGIFLCGASHYPQLIEECVAQASAAASKASSLLMKEMMSKAKVAKVERYLCIGCQNCELVCPYGAISVDKDKKAIINSVLCEDCGICAANCPKHAIKIEYFSDEQLLSMVREGFRFAMPLPEEEPKIVAFLCNWCSYAGADLAGVSRFQYPTNIRIIRTMCSGRVDPLFILKAFLLGADGVLVGGCHKGECHYISGNIEAERRVNKLREKMEEIGINPKRLKLEWISASEGNKFARTVVDFVEEIKGLGLSDIKN